MSGFTKLLENLAKLFKSGGASIVAIIGVILIVSCLLAIRKQWSQGFQEGPFKIVVFAGGVLFGGFLIASGAGIFDGQGSKKIIDDELKNLTSKVEYVQVVEQTPPKILIA